MTTKEKILKALEKFESDLGYTAPELWDMRVRQLRERIEDAFEDEGEGDAEELTHPSP